MKLVSFVVIIQYCIHSDSRVHIELDPIPNPITNHEFAREVEDTARAHGFVDYVFRLQFENSN